MSKEHNIRMYVFISDFTQQRGQAVKFGIQIFSGALQMLYETSIRGVLEQKQNFMESKHYVQLYLGNVNAKMGHSAAR